MATAGLAAAQAPLPGAGSTTAASGTKPLAGILDRGKRLARPDPNMLVAITGPRGRRPAGFRLTPARVLRIAGATSELRRERRDHAGARVEVYTKGTDRWQVSLFKRVPVGDPRVELAQISIWDRDGRVLEAWRGFQVPWTMARGYDGAFGRKVNSPWVWLPLSLLFVLPFVNPRRPFRVLHLDLLVLSAFSVSLAFFNDARIETSVPLVYPLLIYLLLRMLWIGLWRGESVRERARRPLRLLVPVSWIAVALVFLVGFRVALNVTSSNVIDVGYAGVIGADRIGDGRELYGAFPEDNQHGDTYGPAVYAAYLPFEQAIPWSGRWDGLPAAHGAAIAFDVLATLLCFLIGRRVRGPGMGVVLAFAWAAFPFTLYASMTNANDSLVAVLVLGAILAATSTPARGALAALAGLTKFAPLALVPLLAFHYEEDLSKSRELAQRTPHGGAKRRHRVAAFGAGFVVVGGLIAALGLAHSDLGEFWDATIGYQSGRGSPFSIWGLYDYWWLDILQRLVQVCAVLLALVLVLVPRRRDVAGLAALCAAILIALQLGVTHWFYLYIPWFFPLVMLALLTRDAEPRRLPAG